MNARLRDAIPGVLLAVEIFALLVFETRRPLRARTESKLRRDIRNAAVAAIAAIPVAAIERPIAMRLARWIEQRKIGFVHVVRFPEPLRTFAAILLMDYSMYWWHALTHRIDFLWRFHAVHHVDRDMDASTAFRFHAGDMVLSVLWRALQVVVIGASPRAYTIWQTSLTLCIAFHHADIALAPALEKRIAWFFVTPHLHGIHHADREDLEAANWSSGLTVWDRLHRTFRDDVAHDTLRMGLPAYRHDRDAAFPSLMTMPFGPQRDAWISNRDAIA